jgi:hypothetical protein
MITLEDQTPFAEGDNRLCYVDPRDDQRCLKVLKPGSLKHQYQTAKWHKRIRGRRALDDNLREADAYRQSAITKGPDSAWEHLARWHGQVETDLGIANVTQLVGPRPGQSGPTLESLLKSRGLTPEISRALDQLANWLQATGILTRNLLPHNLVAAEQPAGMKLYIIDGLGAPVTARVLALNPLLRRRYINRRIRRMWLRARWEAHGREGLWEEVEQQDR